MKKNISEGGKGKPKKYLFQGQSARSKHWFDLNIGWVEENVSTIESQFYKRLFKINIEGRAGYKYPTFPVPISDRCDS